MIRILPNSENDFQTIRNIAEIVWPVTYSAILSDAQLAYMFDMMYTVDSLQNQVVERKHRFIIAYENEIPLGFASYEFDCEKTNKTKVHKIYILPNRQGKGIGINVMDYISNEAKKNNETAVYLNVNRFNNAKLFYEKLGFKIVKEVDIEIGNGYLMEDYIMEKSL
jgi:ribosomal protein S18 acetylase RimI-like enzyme